MHACMHACMYVTLCQRINRPTSRSLQITKPGTCVNVGCVPKKICHYGGLLGQALKDAKKLGWKVPGEKELEVRHGLFSLFLWMHASRRQWPGHPPFSHAPVRPVTARLVGPGGLGARPPRDAQLHLPPGAQVGQRTYARRSVGRLLDLFVFVFVFCSLVCVGAPPLSFYPTNQPTNQPTDGSNQPINWA